MQAVKLLQALVDVEMDNCHTHLMKTNYKP